LMWRLSLPRTCRSDGHGVAQRRARPQVGEACPYQPYLGELSIILLLWNVIPVLSSWTADKRGRVQRSLLGVTDAPEAKLWRRSCLPDAQAAVPQMQ